MVDGCARIERISFDAFNEATDFFKAVEAYRTSHGFYPKRVLVDKIYCSRATLARCKERGIQITGRLLGRPSKDKEQLREEKRQEYQDICDRNAVEGELGTGKCSYVAVPGGVLQRGESGLDASIGRAGIGWKLTGSSERPEHS